MPGLLLYPGVAMRPVSPFHSWYPQVRSARIALAAVAVAGVVVVAACTDASEKSITAPAGARNSTSFSGQEGSSNPLAHAKHVDLCVDKSSPVGDYTFAYSHQNDQVALDGNRFFDGTYWTDEGGDWHAFAPYGVGGPTNLPDGSVTNFDPSTTIHNDGVTTSCLRPLDRVTASTDFQNGTSLKDNWSGITITYVSNNAVGGATYVRTDCLLDNGTLLAEHNIAPLPATYSAGTSYAQNALVLNVAGNQVFRSLVNNNLGNPLTEGAKWTTADLGPCDTGNQATRAFANFEHGSVITYVFAPAPPTTGTGQIAPTQTSCADYAKGTSSALSEIFAGFKGTTIHNLAPGVFFYYATVTKVAGQAVGTTETVSPNPGGLPSYQVHQGQAYLYTFNGSTCTTVATLGLTNNSTTVSGGAALPAGNYVLGIKFNTGAPAGTVVPSASLTNSGSLLSTHNFQATVNGSAVATTTASINTKAK